VHDGGSLANPVWGAARIHGELLKLGIDVGQTTVAKYEARRRQPLSQAGRRLGERYLLHLLNSNQKYYNEVRTHLSLHKDAPICRQRLKPLIGPGHPPLARARAC
jgi:hypothetical protein